MNFVYILITLYRCDLERIERIIRKEGGRKLVMQRRKVEEGWVGRSTDTFEYKLILDEETWWEVQGRMREPKAIHLSPCGKLACMVAIRNVLDRAVVHYQGKTSLADEYMQDKVDMARARVKAYAATL